MCGFDNMEVVLCQSRGQFVVFLQMSMVGKSAARFDSIAFAVFVMHFRSPFVADVRTAPAQSVPRTLSDCGWRLILATFLRSLQKKWESPRRARGGPTLTALRAVIATLIVRGRWFFATQSSQASTRLCSPSLMIEKRRLITPTTVPWLHYQ